MEEENKVMEENNEDIDAMADSIMGNDPEPTMESVVESTAVNPVKTEVESKKPVEKNPVKDKIEEIEIYLRSIPSPSMLGSKAKAIYEERQDFLKFLKSIV